MGKYLIKPFYYEQLFIAPRLGGLEKISHQTHSSSKAKKLRYPMVAFSWNEFNVGPDHLVRHEQTNCPG